MVFCMGYAGLLDTAAASSLANISAASFWLAGVIQRACLLIRAGVVSA